MPNEPQDENDDYEPADLGDTDDLDEDARLRLAQEADQREIRREILLGQIAVARNSLYAAEEAGDADKVAELRRTIEELTSERDRL